jgi:hypothetical protein
MSLAEIQEAVKGLHREDLQSSPATSPALRPLIP